MAKKKKKKSGIGHVLGTILRFFILTVLVVIIVIGLLVYRKYGARVMAMRNDAIATVESSSPSTFRQTETSLIYDSNGELLSKLAGEKNLYYISYKDIPTNAVNAIVSIEDKKFFSHRGYDPYAILRAAYAYIRNKGVITQGGSTITQQLARNIFLNFDETWERKAREIFISIELEKKYSKQQIMEFYLNNIYFANGYYGLQAASFGYFGKGVSELSLSQTAFLLGIPNSPNRYDPYKNMEGTLGRRDRILGQMLADGKIDGEQYNEAIGESITLKKKKSTTSSYMITYANDCAVKALMKANGFVFKYSFDSDAEEDDYNDLYNKEYDNCQTRLYSGGYRVYTSLNPALQKKLQAALDDGLSESKAKSDDGVYKLQGSAVTVDNDTGRVVAIVGGRTQNFEGQTLNRAYQSFRQPGSSIKPLIVYTPAFEAGYTPNSIVKDEKIDGGPVNADGYFRGDMTIKQAVAVSVNTVAWKLFTEISPATGLNKLFDMGFSRITNDDFYPSAALGGLSHGVSAVEMASGFSTLENAGIFRSPSCIVKITDADGNDIVSDTFYGNEDAYSVYAEDASKMMTTCMEEVMNTGTGRNGKLASMPCAGKTGTTNDAHDLWFVGFTHYYTTSVWVGYDLPASLNDLSQNARPLTIWKNYMEDIHTGLKSVKLSDWKTKKPDTKAATESAIDEDNNPNEENTSDAAINDGNDNAIDNTDNNGGAADNAGGTGENGNGGTANDGAEAGNGGTNANEGQTGTNTGNDNNNQGETGTTTTGGDNGGATGGTTVDANGGNETDAGDGDDATTEPGTDTGTPGEDDNAVEPDTNPSNGNDGTEVNAID